MSRSFMVPGPTLIVPGTATSAGLEVLGLTEEGVRVSIRHFQRPVRSDAAGPEAAADWQRFGEEAELRCRLADYDDVTLMKLIALAMGDAVEGVAGAPGGLIGTGGSAYRIVLRNANKVYRFTTCTLANGQDFVLGSKYMTPEVVFRAWRFVAAGSNTAAGKVLYDHTDA